MRRLQIKTDMQTPWVKAYFDQFMGRVIGWTCPPKPMTQWLKSSQWVLPLLFFSAFGFFPLLFFFPLKSWSEANTVSRGGRIASQPKLYHGGVCTWASHTSMSLQSIGRNRHFRAGWLLRSTLEMHLRTWGAIPWTCLYLLVNYAWSYISSDESHA